MKLDKWVESNNVCVGVCLSVPCPASEEAGLGI